MFTLCQAILLLLMTLPLISLVSAWDIGSAMGESHRRMRQKWPVPGRFVQATSATRSLCGGTVNRVKPNCVHCPPPEAHANPIDASRSEEHTSELQSHSFIS